MKNKKRAKQVVSERLWKNGNPVPDNIDRDGDHIGGSDGYRRSRAGKLEGKCITIDVPFMENFNDPTKFCCTEDGKAIFYCGRDSWDLLIYVLVFDKTTRKGKWYIPTIYFADLIDKNWLHKSIVNGEPSYDLSMKAEEEMRKHATVVNNNESKQLLKVWCDNQRQILASK